MKTIIVNEKQEAEINEIIAFAEKTVYLRTGVNLRIFTNVKNKAADTLTHPPKTMLQIIACTCGCTVDELVAKNRRQCIVEVRQISALLLRKHYDGLTLKEIGSMWGWMDHTTVAHSIDKANQLLENRVERFTSRYIKAAGAIEQWLTNKK